MGGGGREKQKKTRQIAKSEEDTVGEYTSKHQEQTIKRKKKERSKSASEVHVNPRCLSAKL